MTDNTFGAVRMGGAIKGTSGTPCSVGALDKNEAAEHDLAVKRLEQAAEHTAHDRYEEALEALVPPYKGGQPKTRQRYMRLKRDLTLILMARRNPTSPAPSGA